MLEGFWGNSLEAPRSFGGFLSHLSAQGPQRSFPKLLKAMEVFLGALCITGALGFLVGLLVGTCSTLFLMAGKTIRDPEVDHPVSEETDTVSKGSQTSQSYALDQARIQVVERPQGLPKASMEPPEVPSTEGSKDVWVKEEPKPKKTVLDKGHLAIQAGWASAAVTCRRWVKQDPCTKRRACCECGFAAGQRLQSQTDEIWYTSVPSEVFHITKNCGKLRCAKRIMSVNVCQCVECWTAAYKGDQG